MNYIHEKKKPDETEKLRGEYSDERTQRSA